MARKSTPEPKPWVALGISESTYYRRKRKGTLDKPVTPTVKKTVTVKLSKTVTDSEIPALTKPKQRPPHLFKPGQSGNPAGKPKGSRNKLTQDFVEAMCADFAENGVEVIRAVRTSKPEAYLAAMVRLVPQQVEVGEAGAFSDMDEDGLDTFISHAAARLNSYGAGSGSRPH
jgi:hypothetical protein